MRVLRTFLIAVIAVAFAGLMLTNPGWRDRLRRVDWVAVASALFDDAGAPASRGEPATDSPGCRARA
ncbi:MAG: hypothetical protein KF745_04445 [Phycisphaeraceae bacterium]|nr:hypothetical protein [Phycisphaeraceae bacterium]